MSATNPEDSGIATGYLGMFLTDTLTDMTCYLHRQVHLLWPVRPIKKKLKRSSLVSPSQKERGPLGIVIGAFPPYLLNGVVDVPHGLEGEGWLFAFFFLWMLLWPRRYDEVLSPKKKPKVHSASWSASLAAPLHRQVCLDL